MAVGRIREAPSAGLQYPALCLLPSFGFSWVWKITNPHHHHPFHSLGDFLGRFLSGYGPWSTGAPKPLSILVYAVFRCGVAAAVLFCHLVTPTPWLLSEYLSQDYWPWAVILLLGCTQASRGGRAGGRGV